MINMKLWGREIFSKYGKCLKLDGNLLIDPLFQGQFTWGSSIGINVQELDYYSMIENLLIMIRAYEEAKMKSATYFNKWTGVIGESAWKWAFENKEISHIHFKPDRDNWIKDKKTRADFKIGKNGPFLEAYTAPASPYYRYALCKKTKFAFNWDYFIVAKIEYFECNFPMPNGKIYHINLKDNIIEEREKVIEESDFRKIIGVIRLIGFGTRKEIETKNNGWTYCSNNNPCKNSPCYYKLLEDIENDKTRDANALWDILLNRS